MTHSEKRSEALLGALRDDLPSKHDEARLRRKLTSAGIAVGTTVAVANVAQAAAGGSKALGALASTAPAAAAVKNGSLLASAWVGLTTSTKVVVVGAAIAGATYPAVSHWAASRGVEAAAGQAAPLESPAVARAGSASVGAAGAAVAEPNSAPVVAPVSERPLDNSAPSIPVRTTVVGNAAAGKLGARATSGIAGGPARVDEPAMAPSSVTPETAAVDSRLLEETTLIERALVASRANDKSAAQRWLNEHARRFPSGVLARERERLRANSM
jgi:hypothetical protein